MSPGLIGLIVLAVLFATPLSRILIAAVFGKSIGKAALDRQPDTIRLVPADPSALRQAGRVRATAKEFEDAGFSSAGVFSIPEMKGLHVQLLAHTGESMSAAIYDHPVAGVFFDVVSRYVDGSSSTYSTARATGLQQRENTSITNRPGTSATALVQLARRERKPHGLKSCSASSVPTDFVAAYADYIAWFKQRGVSTGEVVEVAKRKVA